MAAIIEFTRPLNGALGSTGGLHAFILLQNDAGEFTYIARGGPEAAIGGSNGLTTEGYDTGIGGPGYVVTNVEPYSGTSGTPAANDFFAPEQLATFQSRVLMSGSEQDMTAAFNTLYGVGQQINDAKIPYNEYSNSNSVAGTFERALGVPPLENGGPGSDRFVPGAENNLLGPQTAGHVDNLISNAEKGISNAVQKLDDLTTSVVDSVKDAITNTINKAVDKAIESIGDFITNWMIPQAGAAELQQPDTTRANEISNNLEQEDAALGAAMRANEISNNLEQEDAALGAAMRANEISNNLEQEDAALGAAMRANEISNNLEQEDAALGAAMRANENLTNLTPNNS